MQGAFSEQTQITQLLDDVVRHLRPTFGACLHGTKEHFRIVQVVRNQQGFLLTLFVAVILFVVSFAYLFALDSFTCRQISSNLSNDFGISLTLTDGDVIFDAHKIVESNGQVTNKSLLRLVGDDLVWLEPLEAIVARIKCDGSSFANESRLTEAVDDRFGRF